MRSCRSTISIAVSVDIIAAPADCIIGMLIKQAEITSTQNCLLRKINITAPLIHTREWQRSISLLKPAG
jgi:hypothetical protein